MRLPPQIFALILVGLALGGPLRGAESEKALADRIFSNADKDKDNALDDKEVLEAKRILKAAIFEKKKADDLPGGKGTFDKIENAATNGKLGKQGSVSKDEWLKHVKAAFDKKQEIIKDAKERIAAKAKQDEQEKIDRLRREKEQLEKKLKQDRKNKK